MLHLQELREEFDIDVKVLGIAGSKKMLLSDAPLDLACWREQYQQCAPLQAAHKAASQPDMLSIHQHGQLAQMSGL